MFADQLQSGEIDVVQFELLPGQSLPAWLRDLRGASREVSITRAVAGARHDVVMRHADHAELQVLAVDRTQIDMFSMPGQAVVSWIAHAGGSGRDRLIEVQCHRFPAAPFNEGLDIGVDDAVADEVRTALRSTRARFDDIGVWLREEFTLPPAPGGTRRRLVHSGGPADDLSDGPKAFTMHGIRWVADVAIVDERLCVVRMTEASSRRQSRWLRLSEVDLRFADRTTAAVATESLRAALAGLADEGRSYIEMWNAYNDIERAAIVDEALRLKWGAYKGWHVLPDGGWRFELHPSERAGAFLRAAESYDGKLELEAAAQLPRELTGSRVRGARSVSVRGTVARIAHGNWTLDVTPPRDGDDNDPPPIGYLFRSLSGDRIRLSRRDQARDRIWSGQAEMPGLAYLLEGVPGAAARQRDDRRYDRVLNEAVRQAFGKGAPTQSQRRALELALRTPDVLLVQGPPGTGKTQFITALLRCLDRLGDKAMAFNRTLITSFQHDAVDNVAGRTRHRGLPPTRVDSRPGRSRQSARQWRDETVTKVSAYLAAHRPEAARRDDVNGLRRLAASYGMQPAGDSDVLHMIDEARRLAGNDLPARLRGKVERMRSQIESRVNTRRALTTSQRDQAARTIRSIRATEAAFADDGPARAAYALQHLADIDVLNKLDRALLDRAGKSRDSASPDLLADLAALRLNLLDRVHSGQSLSTSPTHDPEIDVLLHEIADAAAEAAAVQADSADDVLLAYRADLREDLALVESTLSRYNGVLAATVQQADSAEMSRVLDAPVPVFDTVVVDEAARANPLDLMIPLACARQRIILVGDHKQLPHALEQKVERELLRNMQIRDSDLSMSLFERWFTMFADESPKVRTIRLDTQFRMHPHLGEFVSKVFYGDPKSITAHESTYALTHDLAPYRGKVAVWIDVPHSAGPDKRRGTSRVRQVEARRLVRELRMLADLDRDRELTFGVITFYKAQQEVLEDELVNAGLGVQDDDGQFEPSQAMAWTKQPRPRPRLRVGTVDAFQGMEFDVVLLSITRSSARPDGPARVDDAIQRYGHLLRDSRMCVAMSRQRRLLIAVGDAAMADRESVPVAEGENGQPRSLAEGLVALRELCEGEYGAGIRT
ncbi:DEAD/DEAH box helicase [Micromonospora aurantiaca (nom. illeg.)]|uniref:DEAD/DEAH box helicase n=1 Tax=Micromonospora aurantiaca (nom. illeg.) TaxID=47850 RepID=UPI003F4A316C